jgi:hypothetical protein
MSAMTSSTLSDGAEMVMLELAWSGTRFLLV